MRDLFLHIAAAALAFALAGAASASPSPCAGIDASAGGWLFGDSFEGGDTSAWGAAATPGFSARGILDLDFEVRFAEGFSGQHVLRLKLSTPRGHHYQTLTVPVTSERTRGASVRRLDGYPRPLEVQRLQPASKGAGGAGAVTLKLPVGGTTITSSGLYGLWTAEAYLDDETIACAASLFRLDP